MNHAWEKNGNAVQWSQIPGGKPIDAASPWRCKTCGIKFIHRYNIQPDIYQAMKDAGISEKCDDVKQAINNLARIDANGIIRVSPEAFEILKRQMD